MAFTPFGDLAAQVDPDELRLYRSALARAFDAPEREVVLLQAWVEHPAELPVLLWVAGRAGVSADVVGAQRAQGMSWQRVIARFGVGAGTFRVATLEVPVAGPLRRAVAEFASTDPGQWHQLALTDTEIVALANLRALAAALGVAPSEVVSHFTDLAPDYVALYAQLLLARSTAGPPRR